MQPRQEVIRKLVTEYQKTKSVASFEGILKRVDDIIVGKILHLQNILPHLKNVNFSDVYQTAIVGVGNAITTARDNENGNIITARIIAYVKAAIKKTYKPVKEISGSNVVFEFMKMYDVTEESYEIQYDTAEFCVVKCAKILSPLEIELIHQIFCLGVSYSCAANNIGIKRGCAHYKVMKALEKLRLNLTDEDYEFFGQKRKVTV